MWFGETSGLKIRGITADTNNGEAVEIKIGEESAGQKKKYRAFENLSNDEKEDVEKVLFLLDRHCVSDNFYHEMVQLRRNSGLPKLYLVKQRRTELHN